MDENIRNEIVEMTKVDPVQLAEANEALLNKAIAETVSALPETANKKSISSGTNLAIGIGTFFGGLAAGAAIDHWVVPAIGKGLEKLKEKRAEKKAAKQAKKAAKAAAKAQKTPEPAAPAAPTKTDDGIDPTTVDTTIKD